MPTPAKLEAALDEIISLVESRAYHPAGFRDADLLAQIYAIAKEAAGHL